MRAGLRPVVGADKVARLFLGLMRRERDVELTQADVNRTPGSTVRVAGSTIAVLALDVHDGLVTQLWLVVNPDKLHAWTGDEPRTGITGCPRQGR
ncbi:hypothetical protein ACFVXW_12390 [Streptomyces sp. NPDC058251]|uniref:hypothetical protein n=1 Tax=Streptomyces sp. NPDC058251 TaxID=3346404 RepID=UPI0036EA6FA9